MTSFSVSFLAILMLVIVGSIPATAGSIRHSKMVTGDFDGDGYDELVSTSTSLSRKLILTDDLNGEPKMLEIGECHKDVCSGSAGEWYMLTGDYNNDGILDLMLVRTTMQQATRTAMDVLNNTPQKPKQAQINYQLFINLGEFKFESSGPNQLQTELLD